MEFFRETPPGRAKTPLTPEQVGTLLALPEGQHVTSMYFQPDPPTLWVMLEGQGLPEAVPGGEAPVVIRHIERVTHILVEDKVRWS